MTLTDDEIAAINKKIADLGVQIVDLRVILMKDEIEKMPPVDKVAQIMAAAEMEKRSILKSADRKKSVSMETPITDEGIKEQ